MVTCILPECVQPVAYMYQLLIPKIHPCLGAPLCKATSMLQNNKNNVTKIITILT